MDQLLRAPSVGNHNSTRVDEGRKSWNLLAIKMQATNRSGEGGEEPDMWPRIWITTRREREQKGEDNKWDGKKKKCFEKIINKIIVLIPGIDVAAVTLLPYVWYTYK